MSINNKYKNRQNSFSFETFFRFYLDAIRSKTLFFFYPFYDSNVEVLLKCLEKDSRISGYQVQSIVGNLPADQQQGKNEKCIKIFLNYDLVRNRPLVQKVTFYSSQGRKRIATVKTLQKFRILYPNSLAILGTHHGILSIQDCILKNCGGEFLVSIA